MNTQSAQDSDYKTLVDNHRIFKRFLIENISKNNDKYDVLFSNGSTLKFNNIQYIFKIYYVLREPTTISKQNEKIIDEFILKQLHDIFSGLKNAQIKSWIC